MRVLVACEFSGTVREAFKAKGHDAWSCDLLPTEIPGNHIQGDILEILNDGWDLMIGHPPCTYLCVAGVQYMKNNSLRWKLFDEAQNFFKLLLYANINKICIENPIHHGFAKARIEPYSQIVRMWQFGHPEAHKPTCLWLKNLPVLKPTNIVIPLPSKKYPSGKVLSQWRAKSGTAKQRSRTFPGIAAAMADQWGNL